MSYTQPVFYEFEKIAAPVLLLIGDQDTRRSGRTPRRPPTRRGLGNYPVLGKEAAARMPRAHLVEFPRTRPRAADPGARVFHKALLDNLQHRQPRQWNTTLLLVKSWRSRRWSGDFRIL